MEFIVTNAITSNPNEYNIEYNFCSQGDGIIWALILLSL